MDWECAVCTLLNPDGERRCLVCGEGRLKLARPATPEQEDVEDEPASDDDDDDFDDERFSLPDAAAHPVPLVRGIEFNPSDVLPSEAVVAWGLKPRMEMRLVFETGAAQSAMRLERAVLHSYEAGGQLAKPALGDGCIVAQQLEQIVTQYWRTHRVDAVQPMADTSRYLLQRLPTLSEHCALCDAKHAFGSMINPSVCQRALCAHHYWNHRPVPSSWETPTKRRPQNHLYHLARKVKAAL